MTSKQSFLLHLDNARRPTRSPKKKARTFPVGQVVRTPMNSLTGSVYHMLTQVMMMMTTMIVMIVVICIVMTDDDDQNDPCNE